MQQAILEIRDLVIDFRTDGREVRVVDGVSLKIRSGERWGLVGESGAGKSLTARAALALIAPPGRVSSGEILLDGRQLLELSESELRHVRGREVGLVFQNPSTALNPAFRTGWQLEESLRSHVDLPRAVVRDRALSLLSEVGISEPALLARRYPHEFSGGMQQRLYIAMSLIAAPRLLIADEPTTALDVTIQAQILDLLQYVVAHSGMTLLLITHDMGVVASVCDHVAVMYAGEVVEEATVDDLFRNPLHPYTRALLECLPDPTKARRRLKAIPGTGPHSVDQSAGCRFRDRCQLAQDVCGDHPDLLEVEAHHAVRCWVSQKERQLPEIADIQPSGRVQGRGDVAPEQVANADSAVVLLQNVSKHFWVRSGVLRSPLQVHAVDRVTLEIHSGETLGIVGESGSGKSTLARLMVRLEKPTSGSVIFDGMLTSSPRSSHPQMVFQDPYSSLDPHMTVGDSVGEPLIGVGAEEKRTRVREMLSLVGLEAGAFHQYPHRLSGGQLQRTCVARALIGGTKLIVLDEALSSLDASLQVSMVDLLDELKSTLGLTYVFISHNLLVVDAVADRTGVMYLGKLVELGRSEGLRSHPLHPYTVALHSAVPVPNPEFERQRERLILHGEVGSSLRPPSGCRFHPRCPLATELCREKEPELAEHLPGHWAACHFSGEWSAYSTGQPQSLSGRLSRV